MKWLKGITVGIFLIGLLIPLTLADQHPIWEMPTSKKPKGIKTETKTRYGFKKRAGEYQRFLKTQLVRKYNEVGHPVEFQSRGWPRMEKLVTCETDHDARGNEIERRLYKPDGSLTSRTTFKYDDQSNQTECASYRPNIDEPDGSLTERMTFKYDDQGNMIEDAIYRPNIDEPKVKHVRKYDEQGNHIKSILYSNGKLYVTLVFKYDAKGNKTEEISVNRDGTVTSKTIYEYDDKGNNIKLSQYDAEGNLTNESFYGYDIQGNKIVDADYFPPGQYFPGIINLIIYKYDPRGHKIEEISYYKNRLVGKDTYKYDDRGNLIEETHYGVEREDGKDIEIPKEQIVYEYEFYPEDKESEEPEKK